MDLGDANMDPDGPDKWDSHANEIWTYEGDELRQFLADNDMIVVCGDRHWQYHSIHPSGFEEFSVGALHDANSRMGVAPGDPSGTDPGAKINQLYASPEPSGGFLIVTVDPAGGAGGVKATFELMDENGALMYSVERRLD